MTSENKIFTEFDKNIDSLLENHKNIVAVKKLNFITNPTTKVTKVEQIFFAELVKDIIRVYE